MKFSTLSRSLVPGLFIACLVSCGSGQDDQAAGPAHQEHEAEGHGHSHSSPNGGLLIVLGEEAAHLELLHDAEAGELRANVLGAHAEKYIRIAQPNIEVQVAGIEGVMTLAAVESALSGETTGDTSVFAATDPRLAGIELQGGTVKKVEMLGSTYENVAFGEGK